MTREEAIKILKVYRFLLEGSLNQDKPAFDLAIESLSADEEKENGTFVNRDNCTFNCNDSNRPLVEVVRCKDCRHQEFYINDTESFYCHKTGIVNMHIEDGDGEFFCKYGERKEE